MDTVSQFLLECVGHCIYFIYNFQRVEEFVHMWASQYFYCSYSQLTRVKTAVKILSITLETSLSLILEIPHELYGFLSMDNIPAPFR